MILRARVQKREQVSSSQSPATSGRQSAPNRSTSTPSPIPSNRKFKYLCKFCSFSQISKNALKDHLRDEHDFDPNDCIGVQCLQCEQTFASHREYDIHRRKDHMKKTTFKCEFTPCTGEFNSTNALMKHHNCHIRNGIVLQKGKNLRASEPNDAAENAPLNEDPPERAESSTEPDIINYICEICCKRFTLAQGFSAHCKAKGHLYDCSQCTRKFYLQQFLHKHLVSHAKNKDKDKLVIQNDEPVQVNQEAVDAIEVNFEHENLPNQPENSIKRSTDEGMTMDFNNTRIETQNSFLTALNSASTSAKSPCQLEFTSHHHAHVPNLGLNDASPAYALQVEAPPSPAMTNVPIPTPPNTPPIPMVLSTPSPPPEPNDSSPSRSIRIVPSNPAPAQTNSPFPYIMPYPNQPGMVSYYSYPYHLQPGFMSSPSHVNLIVNNNYYNEQPQRAPFYTNSSWRQERPFFGAFNNRWPNYNWRG